MSRPFAITAASNSVFLDENRRGEASFTVSNQSGRSIRGQARLVSDDADVSSWLTLRGQAEREFSTAGTERYTVDIDVPPDAPSGSHSFRLDMVGERRPDEEYVDGPTVTFQVPDVKESQPFPWKIVAAIAAVILFGGGLLAYAILSDTDPGTGEGATAVVPDVSGLTIAQASDSLQAAGFHTLEFEEEHNDSVATNRVIATNPLAQAEATTDNPVILRLSLGPALVSVPDVANTPPDVAFNRITESRLVLAALRAEHHNQVPKDNIIGTDPGAGEEVYEGSELTLIVSAGRAETNGGGWTIPDWFLDRQVEVFGQVSPNITGDTILQPGQTMQFTPDRRPPIIDQSQLDRPNPLDQQSNP